VTNYQDKLMNSGHNDHSCKDLYLKVRVIAYISWIAAIPHLFMQITNDERGYDALILISIGFAAIISVWNINKNKLIKNVLFILVILLYLFAYAQMLRN
jgi:cation transport ATPase